MMTSVTSKTFLLLTSVFLYFCVIQARQDDEFYCKVSEDKYKICRRCPTLNEDCEEPLPNDGCKCENLEFTNYECKFFVIIYVLVVIDVSHLKKKRIFFMKKIHRGKVIYPKYSIHSI